MAEKKEELAGLDAPCVAGDSRLEQLHVAGQTLLGLANREIALMRAQRATGRRTEKQAALLSHLQQLEETLDEALGDWAANLDIAERTHAPDGSALDVADLE